MLYLSDVEVQELHDEAVRAPVVNLRHALHEVVMGGAQPLEHAPLSPERVDEYFAKKLLIDKIASFFLRMFSKIFPPA